MKGTIWNGTKNVRSFNESIFIQQNKIFLLQCIFLQIVLVQELSQVVPDFASRWQHMPLDLRGDAAFQEGLRWGGGWLNSL